MAQYTLRKQALEGASEMPLEKCRVFAADWRGGIMVRYLWPWTESNTELPSMDAESSLLLVKEVSFYLSLSENIV